ncbi:MAG: exodeoxyribonuclease VII small subunit [Bacteriovoracia bacterium]
MGTKVTDAKESVALEDSLLKLEKIVQELEKGQLGLDESLSRFETGVKLYQSCRKSLQEAEKKIKVLTDGLKEVPWEE